MFAAMAEPNDMDRVFWRVVLSESHTVKTLAQAANRAPRLSIVLASRRVRMVTPLTPFEWYSNEYHSRYTLIMAKPDRTVHRLAATLREARLRANLSLRQLAERAGTSHSTLVDYEQGRKVPSVVTFIKIVEACDLALDFTLSPRIREVDGITRGEELRAVLELAEQFPARVSRRVRHPLFGRPG